MMTNMCIEIFQYCYNLFCLTFYGTMMLFLDYCPYYICTNDQNNIAYWEESEQIEALANNFGLSQIQLGILVWKQHQ